MNSNEIRKEARNKLSGKWGNAVSITFAYFIATAILNLIENNISKDLESFVSLIISIISVPLSFGLIFSYAKLFINENVKSFDFIKTALDNFKRAWSISFQVFLKTLVPLILVILSIVLMCYGSTESYYSNHTLYFNAKTTLLSAFCLGLITFIFSIIWFTTKSYYYKLAYIVAIDNPDLPSKEVVNLCKELMINNRWRLFCLNFSFIGWAFLSIITFGLGFLWLTPYIQFSEFAFYEEISKKSSKKANNEENNEAIKNKEILENNDPIQ